MAKQKKQEARTISPTERLGLRVSAMIGSPKAQLERQARIHRLDTDTDEAWDGVMELLKETDGLRLEHEEEGDVIVRWNALTDDDLVADVEEVVQEEAAPF